ncbi:MAG: methionine gamma-lyase family protein [Eubacteriales bacterium]|nr:methionine gamma-lyase family protein [Eubacteriales bacterium]
MEFTNKIIELVNKCQEKAKEQFKYVEDIALYNQNKVLTAFQNNRIATRHFANTTGYGYDDIGRDTLSKLLAEIFVAEDAILSPNIVSGTHALTLMLFGVLRPKDNFAYITGTPYDTLREVIYGENIGSLKDFGVNFEAVELVDGEFDKSKIKELLTSKKMKMLVIQRSRGYEWRDALSISKIKDIIEFIKDIDKDVIVAIDNCYGEFVEKQEPTEVGADLLAGSMIKNLGGGIAPTGGYIVGRKDLIEQVSYRLTAPSIGSEVGSYNSSYQPFYLGIFLAPTVVSSAIKTSILFGYVFNELGYKTSPSLDSRCYDIIRSIEFNTAEELIKFIQSVQYASPIDSYVTPMPWAMPGYQDEVIMAAGTFVSGASIELSADSPIRAPYIAYLQGGLTYEHGKLAVMTCADEILKTRK